ncbi:MAG: UDP-glucose 4-epimerase, partial [Actinomycetota bacterium]|nr:UDP-glucose 4-epimerase [Actinomycetota bacterium]
MSRTVLLTGGAGYIGSHTAVELIQAGWSVVIVDNLANSSPVAVERVAELTDTALHAAGGELSFHHVDILDRAGLDEVFAEHEIDAVVHFAGLKAVGESVEKPLEYHRTNVGGTVVLLEAMRDAGVRSMVFSSSATVYGDPDRVPVTEDSRLGPTTNPYGRSKLYIEDMLRDLPVAEEGWHIALLRYFNPVGAHPSGRIGEDPNGLPNNLLPFVMQVAVGRLEKVRVFGDDYATPDGTGVRDYIHVVDLARGHLAALERLGGIDGCIAVNLGTGTGSSVLEVIAA